MTHDEYPGCHGIALQGDARWVDLGTVINPTTNRIADVAVGAVPPLDARAKQLWWVLTEDRDGRPAVRSEVWRDADGGVRAISDRLPTVRVRWSSGDSPAAITIEPANGWPYLQHGLVSFALPVIAQKTGALLLHASAIATRNGCTVVCAEGGSGKSSIATALALRGWEYLTDDCCAVEVGERGGRVWPGPPWSYLRPGPLTVSLRSEPTIGAKPAWSLRGAAASRPRDVARVVVLEPFGGDAMGISVLSLGAAIQAVSKHSMWFLDPADEAVAYFPQLVAFLKDTPVFKVRFPHREDWLELAVDAFTDPAGLTAR